jgi:hypothetical protein
MIGENKRTWLDMVGFYRGLLKRPQWKFLEPLERFVQGMASSEHADAFRAGQSLYHLMISTALKHGLEGDEPFVSVTVNSDTGLFELTYWRKTGGPVVIERSCDEAMIMQEVDLLLERLWRDTKGDVPIA